LGALAPLTSTAGSAAATNEALAIEGQVEKTCVFSSLSSKCRDIVTANGAVNGRSCDAASKGNTVSPVERKNQSKSESQF
jgi:hypothetical protein